MKNRKIKSETFVKVPFGYYRWTNMVHYHTNFGDDTYCMVNNNFPYTEQRKRINHKNEAWCILRREKI